MNNDTNVTSLFTYSDAARQQRGCLKTRFHKILRLRLLVDGYPPLTPNQLLPESHTMHFTPTYKCKMALSSPFL